MPDENPAMKQQLQMKRAIRRAIRRDILLPSILAFALIIILTVIALVSTRSAPIANIFMTLFLLCPLVLCMLPVYLVLMVLIVMMGRANTAVGKGLFHASTITSTAGDRVTSALERAARVTVGWNSRFAFIDRIASRIFDQPQGEDDK